MKVNFAFVASKAVIVRKSRRTFGVPSPVGEGGSRRLTDEALKETERYKAIVLKLSKSL